MSFEAHTNHRILIYESGTMLYDHAAGGHLALYDTLEDAMMDT